MRLIIRENGQERVVESDSEVVSIGRETDNTIDIDSPTSSRHHCEIRRTGTGHEVVDLESRNGTLVNGERCGKKPLNPGDRIEIGTTVFYFETAPDEGARPTAPQGVAPAPRHRAQASGWERERENLYRVLEINQFLLSETDLRALLSRILDTVVDVTGAERGFLILCEGGDLKVKASRNIDGEDVKKPAEKISHSIALRVAADGVPVLSEDAEADDRFREFGTVRDLKLRSVLCVPFRVGERVTGVVYVDNRFERGVFTQDDLHYAELVADQAALAIERARLSEDKARTERDLVQERERRAELEVQVDPQARHRAALSALEALESQGEKDRRRVEAIRARLKHDYSEIVTASPKMFEIFTVLDKVIDSTVPVLIQGESGTGKELIARAIHFNGPRGKKPYVSENCAAIPATLLESEFFGYVRGAFTGAHKDKKGLFEVAHTGTLFLDEIGDMNPDLQSKFLRVLQEGEIRRVGGKNIIKVDVRILCATNRDLTAMIAKRHFREDLYYRINVINVRLPPLRERREDVPLLVDFFLGRSAAKLGMPKREISREALAVLCQHEWPGNIRELENEIERMAALSRGVMRVEDLSEQLRPREGSSAPLAEGASLKDIVARSTEEVEREAIVEGLRKHGWNKSKTADGLGIARPTLEAKIEKYGLTREVVMKGGA